jgi:hypothetical protein
MDFLPDIEFHPVFNRISKLVNLEGCGTPEEINSRLNRKINEYKQIYGAGPFGPFQVQSRISGLRNLVAAGFGRRCIDEAIAYPHGIVALTLKYGRKRAELILTRRKRIM